MKQVVEEIKKVVKDYEDAQKQVGAFRGTMMKARAYELIKKILESEKEEEWWNG